MRSLSPLALPLLLAAACSSAPPAGTPGDVAEARAKKMVAAVDGEAWARTGAVRWVFEGDNDHLWDRRRGFSRVRWDEHEVVFSIDDRVGLAFTGGEALSGAQAKEKLDEAHARWTNDAFWLNPVVKAFDPGTERAAVPPRESGEPGLLVRYRSGGRTPGDAYLWWLDPDGSGRPVAWQMWTSNIPVGGVEASWDGWTELESGALVSTRHETSLFTLELSEVAGAESIAEIVEGDDPFAELVACRGKDACVAF